MNPNGPWNGPGEHYGPAAPYVVHHGWWYGPLHLLPVLLLLALIGVIIWGVLRLSHQAPAGAVAAQAAGGPPAPLPTHDPAQEELRLRYARGEMDQEEFLRRRADLGGAPVGAAPPQTPPEQQE